jgi:hypothetical protein
MAASSMSTASVPRTTSSKTIFYISSVLILPVLYVFFYILQVWTKGSVIESWLKWDRLLIIASIIVMERIYTYRYAVSQKAVLGRDIIANIVTIYLVYPVTAMIMLPLLAFIPEHFLAGACLSRSTWSLLASDRGDSTLGEFLSLLDASPPAHKLIPVGASLISPSDNRPESLEWRCFQSGRFRAA